MMRTDEIVPALPAGWQRCLVSLLVVAHFVAILTAVTSFSHPDFPAPAVAVLANRPFRPYLQATFLSNAYRFFAPNPGAPTVLWFRIQHEDGTVCWGEAPRTGRWLRPGYQRDLNLTMSLGQYLMPEGDNRAFTPIGAIAVASYARYLAREIAAHHDRVKAVGIYCVQHSVLLPEQIRAGWAVHDLPTYRATFAGAFSPVGERVDKHRPLVLDQPITRVAAGILAVDFYPRLRRRPGVEAGQLAEELGLPVPIRRLLAAYPELQHPPRADVPLEALLEELLQSPGTADR
ncbi:MAG: hypothetical protein AB7K24_02705 [Gemmataceae bacterium]